MSIIAPITPLYKMAVHHAPCAVNKQTSWLVRGAKSGYSLYEMANRTAQHPADYIVPLNMNGLQGRMLHLPAPAGRKREILLLYGHHSSLERWWGIAQVLNRYGAVTMPDLPGFGGMDSLYKIGRKPS